MAAASIGPVKAMVLGLEVAQLTDFMTALRERKGRSVRTELQAYARDHGHTI
jgi:signal transduction protein with GAF and PtsI domain